MSLSMNAFSTPMTSNTQFMSQTPNQFNNGMSQTQQQPNLMMNLGFSNNFMVQPMQVQMPLPQFTYAAPPFNNVHPANLFAPPLLNPNVFAQPMTFQTPTVPQLNASTCMNIEQNVVVNTGTEFSPVPKNFDSYNLPVNHSFFLQCVGPDGIESFQAISKDFMLNPDKHAILLYNGETEKLEPYTVKAINKPAIVHSVKKNVLPKQDQGTVGTSTVYSAPKNSESNEEFKQPQSKRTRFAEKRNPPGFGKLMNTDHQMKNDGYHSVYHVDSYSRRPKLNLRDNASAGRSTSRPVEMQNDHFDDETRSRNPSVCRSMPHSGYHRRSCSRTTVGHFRTSDESGSPSYEEPSISLVDSSSSVSTRSVRTSTGTPVRRKNKFRSKQKKINRVHGNVSSTFSHVLAGEDELVRGDNVVRVHVKKFECLNRIEGALDEVDSNVRILKMALPISKKNKKQKKGFIVYMRVEGKENVPLVQSIFNRHGFDECVVAPQKDQTILAHNLGKCNKEGHGICNGKQLQLVEVNSTTNENSLRDEEKFKMMKNNSINPEPTAEERKVNEAKGSIANMKFEVDCLNSCSNLVLGPPDLDMLEQEGKQTC